MYSNQLLQKSPRFEWQVPQVQEITTVVTAGGPVPASQESESTTGNIS